MYQRDFDFSAENNSNKLSVVLMADSFFYAIFDIDGLLISHHSYTGGRFSDSAFIAQIKSNTQLTSSYESVSVIVLSGVMHQIDTPENDLLQLLPGLSLKNIKLEKIPGQNIYNYYGLTPHQEVLLNEIFGEGNYTLRSFTSLLSTYFLGNNEPMLHLHLEDGVTFLYIQKAGKMYLYNSFNTKSMNDILYFTLASCKAMDLQSNIDKVTVSGWIEKDSTLYKQLQGYIKNIQIINDPLFLIHSSLKDKLKSHYFFVHHCNILCAS